MYVRLTLGVLEKKKKKKRAMVGKGWFGGHCLKAVAANTPWPSPGFSFYSRSPRAP